MKKPFSTTGIFHSRNCFTLTSSRKPDLLPLDHPKVKQAQAKLFGAWEMNWMLYNYSHDLKLPNSNGSEIGFLMYPQLEEANGRRDSLDPEHFKYTITAKEI